MSPTPAERGVHIAGAAQGVVVGDHARVTMNFDARRERFVPREAPALPAHWVERPGLAALATTALGAGGASVVALVGMGGAGKSRLAARIAQELATDYPGGCFWIDLAVGSADDALARIALAFGQDIAMLATREARAQTVRSLLAGQRVLLVLDDAWTVEAAQPFLPPAAGCGALLTTRNDAIASSLAQEVIAIDRLPAEDAVRLLAATAGAPEDEALLAELAHRLGGLPLALELTGKLARQQARRPGFVWARFAAAYGSGSGRLGSGLAGASVRTAFAQTWQRALGAEAQRAFALLGLFEPGEIEAGEAAAAWGCDAAAAQALLDELFDLSLAQPVDAGRLRLHPLLADYAQEQAAARPADERRVAHGRIADHWFERAPRPPRSIAELRPVLRSHWHAGAAGDGDRAARVYPWFGEGDAQISVKGLLTGRGQYALHVKHQRVALALLADSSAYARMWGHYFLGDALLSADRHAEAAQELARAVAMLDAEDMDEDARTISEGKFVSALGHARRLMGDVAGAEQAYRRAVAHDRRLVAGGGVLGALNGALIAQLQIGDLRASTGVEADREQALTLFRDTFDEALREGEANVAVMAAERLARACRQRDAAEALHFVQAARGIGAQAEHAFGGRQGARYARQLATVAVDLAYDGEPALDDALVLLALAIVNAGRSDAALELGAALYELGNLFEHYHLLDREAPLAASWACYSLCEACTAEHEDGTPLSAQERIRTRLVPRMDAAAQAAAEAAVAADPWALIDAALAPYALNWRPGG
ncbi:MAG TPA: NB-ARC domain-containing protein [Methylibium sp.]|nr:NB-ARC domain-containing protein [Methylibium sp.]